MTDLPDLSAVELLTLYRDRRASPVEVMTAVLDRVEALEPQLNATWARDPDAALADARASEARWAKGEPIGALDGVPVTVKELIATKGVAKPLGTAATDLSPSPPTRRRRRGCARPGR
jgi:aspartyl-tRNA(Asn)/glutamyl-tRNA(Gln) amidotransferase subunit A